MNLFIKRLIWFSFWWWTRCPQVWILFAATVRQTSSSTCFRAINSNQVVLHTSPWLWRGLGLVHTFASSGGSSIILKMWKFSFKATLPIICIAKVSFSASIPKDHMGGMADMWKEKVEKIYLVQQQEQEFFSFVKSLFLFSKVLTPSQALQKATVI